MIGPRFYVGTHKAHHAKQLDHCMVSYNMLRLRRSFFPAGEWIMDSGAFTIVNKYGGYPEPVEVYAEEIMRWSWCGKLMAAVSQDYMCEPFVIARTGLSVAEHQRLTIDRYCQLRRLVPYRIHIMPVLQGYHPSEYADHVRQYDHLLTKGMWVGVGSVCKRNAKSSAIVAVLDAIHRVRPDLRLHGFGIKLTSLADSCVTDRLYSADSMAWSLSARKQGRNGNSVEEALRFRDRVAVVTEAAVNPVQMRFAL